MLNKLKLITIEEDQFSLYLYCIEVHFKVLLLIFLVIKITKRPNENIKFFF